MANVKHAPLLGGRSATFAVSHLPFAFFTDARAKPTVNGEPTLQR